MVCLEDVRPADVIWNCAGCFTPYHMHCIQQWVRDGNAVSTLSDEVFPDQKRLWYCPKCRREHNAKTEFPESYLCFCRKVRDPPFDPWLTPHSCGEVCGRSLGCEHECVLLCHPGRCPPCPRTVPKAPCFCGASTEPRRCGARQYTCGRVCGRLLECKAHRCTSVCHAGPCTTCYRKSRQPCRCGRGEQERPCSTPAWECTEVCGRVRSCKFHTCTRVCCPGGCEVCPLVADRTCPCGRVQSDAPCQEEVALCGATCGKPLDCGHDCPDRCHRGACGACRQIVVKTCRCGNTSKEAPCHAKPLLCSRKCTVPKACGRHACKRKCCDGTSCPPCDEVCGRRLNCGQHKCQAPCHSGKCYPCAVVKTVHCACKSSEKSVPCGREKVTMAPRCKEACATKPPCSHQQPPHACHFGPCPQCTQKCALPLPDCQHACQVRCAGCLSSGRVESCPPCSETVPMACFGGHQDRQVRCSRRVPFACEGTCGKPLPCGRHACASLCHPKACLPCTAHCDRSRPAGCTHTCPQTCHDTACKPCDVSIQAECHCGKLKLKHPCGSWTSLVDGSERESAQSCKDRCPKHLACGHRCSKLCHSGDCITPTECKKRVVVRCKCSRRKTDYICGAAVGSKKAPTTPACDSECAAAAQAKAEPIEASDADDDCDSDDDGAAGPRESGKERRRRRWQEKQDSKARKLATQTKEPINIVSVVAAVCLALIIAYFLV